MRVKLNKTVDNFFVTFNTLYPDMFTSLFGYDIDMQNILDCLQSEIDYQGGKYLTNYYTRLYYKDVNIYLATLINNLYYNYREKWIAFKNSLAIIINSDIQAPYTDITHTNIQDDKTKSIQNKRNNFDNTITDTNTDSKQETDNNTVGQVVNKSRSDTLHNVWDNFDLKNKSLRQSLINRIVIDVVDYACLKVY